MAFWDFLDDFGAVGSALGGVLGPVGAIAGRVVGEGLDELIGPPSGLLPAFSVGESKAPTTEVDMAGGDFWSELGSGLAQSLPDIIGAFRGRGDLQTMGMSQLPQIRNLPSILGAGGGMGGAGRTVAIGGGMIAILDALGNVIGIRRRRHRRRRLTKGMIADLTILKSILGPRSPALTVMAMRAV